MASTRVILLIYCRGVVVVDMDGPKNEEFVELQDPVPQQAEILERVLEYAN